MNLHVPVFMGPEVCSCFPDFPHGQPCEKSTLGGAVHFARHGLEFVLKVSSVGVMILIASGGSSKSLQLYLGGFDSGEARIELSSRGTFVIIIFIDKPHNFDMAVRQHQWYHVGW